ncbi:methyltransferase domain-containing protein [Candidatus Shapirobacteria bacterium]|nr:methyltransferase domain-containing protein [Candidatus Shapirobacteria bacterium]
MKGEVRINLGSGPDGVQGWINYDWGWLPFLAKIPLLRRLLVSLGILDKSYQRDWREVVLHDLRKGIPLMANSVDWIYSSNFLEHLEKYEAEELLKECLRVLKQNGKIRLVVPDLKKIMDKYLKNGDADVFCREFYGFDKDKNMGLGKSAIRGHQWMYDFENLSRLINKVGFTKIKNSAYRKSSMKDVDILDLPIHQELGLYIEASKV